MKEKNEKCENCRFWRGQRCRRYPPTPCDGGEFSPATEAKAWCGEWQQSGQEQLRPESIASE